MRIFLIALASIALSVAAQFCLKAGMSSPAVRGLAGESLGWRTLPAVLGNGFVLSGFLLYGLGAVVWLAVLTKWDVSKAYPMVGLGFGMTAIVGLLMGENVSMLRGAGIALICAGVFLVGKS